jgi:hypothetical protein
MTRPPDPWSEGWPEPPAEQSADLEELIPTAAVDAELLPAPTNPVAVARVLIKDYYQHPEGLTLLWWRGDFYAWTGTHSIRRPRASSLIRSRSRSRSNWIEPPCAGPALHRNRGAF